MNSLIQLIERLALHVTNMPAFRKRIGTLVNSTSSPSETIEQGVFLGTSLISLGQLPGPVVLPFASFEKSCYLLGASGCGKTTALMSIFSALLGRVGIVLIDLYGDLVDRALLAVCDHQTAKGSAINLCVIDFRQPELLPPVNLLSSASGVSDPWSRAAVMLQALRETSGGVWGTTIESCARNVFLALAMNNRPLNDSLAVLMSKELQNDLLSRVDDEPCQAWFAMLNQLSVTKQHDLTAPFLNRISHLTTRPELRAFFGTAQSISFHEMLNRAENPPVILIGLGGTMIGQSTGRLLGTMLVSSLAHVILSRASQPQNKRLPVRVILDEFENFGGINTFGTLLCEGRRYAASLLLAHQNARQISRELFDSVTGNAGTMLLFQSAAEQASRILPNIITKVPKADLLKDLISQPVGHCWMLRRGQTSIPLALRNYTDPRIGQERISEMRREAAARYKPPDSPVDLPEVELASHMTMEVEDVSTPDIEGDL